MMDWLLRRLADRLGVEPARAGEAITPQIRFEQPWSQGVTLLVVLGCAGLIVWLYRREGQLSLPTSWSWPRCGSPWSCWRSSCSPRPCCRSSGPACPTSSSWSTTRPAQQIVDQYANPKTKAALAELTLAKARPGKDPRPSRLAVAQGWLPRTTPGPPRAPEAEQGPALPRLRLGPAAGRGRQARGRRAGAREAQGGRGRPAARPGSATASGRS